MQSQSNPKLSGDGDGYQPEPELQQPDFKDKVQLLQEDSTDSKTKTNSDTNAQASTTSNQLQAYR